MFNYSEYELADKGEIVSTKSALAFDEEIVCKQCGYVFTLVEGNYEGTHDKFPSIKTYGIKCPNCERVNITYVKTPRLKTLEESIKNAPTETIAQKRRAKYQREFKRVNKKFGRINVTV